MSAGARRATAEGGFEARRVLETSLLLGLAVMGVAGWMGGLLGLGGVLLGLGLACLAFLSLEKSLRGAVAVAEAEMTSPRQARLVLGSMARMAALAVPAALISWSWGAAGGGGFLAGLVVVKVAVVVEGIRSAGG